METFSLPPDTLSLNHSSLNLSSVDNPLDVISFFDVYEGKLENQKVIALTKYPLSNNYFSTINSTYDMGIISLDQSSFYTPQFTIEDFLLMEILQLILPMQIQRKSMEHYETRGCLFDFCANKQDIVTSLYSGSICQECKAKLSYYGISAEEIISAQKILWEISKDFYSDRIRGCPAGYSVCSEYHDIKQGYSDENIFLATSFNPTSLDEADHLKTKLSNEGFYLHVVNDDITNKNILCKICKTIQTCKFGIADFTTLRHNISYEFGLMQAFGLKSIAIIKQESFDDFKRQLSDMNGIEVIPYETITKDLYDSIKQFISI